MGATLVDARTEMLVKKMAVRADIQALRAVAVGLVFLHHLWPGDLTGGYVGVDIFFVISGFLITRHLKREVDLTGTVKLSRFWARRVKRLLPAAILVLVASALITALVLPLTSAQSAYRQVGAAGTYVLNWMLAADSLDYFAQGALSPVTHYWSLSVEEQFYIAWPLIIFIGLLFSRSKSERVRHWTMLATLALVFLGSFAWAVWSVAAEPSAAYFNTGGRAWEFAAGGLLAFLPAKQWRSLRIKAGLSWGLWAIVIVCALVYGPTTGVPGAAALIPVAATAALIWIGDGGSRLSPQRLFAVRPVQVVGDISYSLYLWHWPLIVGATYVLGGHLGGVHKLAIVLLTVALAWPTKDYVEDPIRLAKMRPLNNPLVILVATAVSIAILWGGVTVATPDIDGRARAAVAELNERVATDDPCFGARVAFADCPSSHTLSNIDYALISRELEDQAVSNGSYCMQKLGQAEVATCSFGVEEGTQDLDVAVVGDSHAARLVFPLDSISSAHNLRVHSYLAEACAAMENDLIAVAGSTKKQISRACNEWRSTVIGELEASPAIDIIVATSFDTAYFQTDAPTVRDTGDGYVRAWQRWLDAGKTVIVINDVPRHPGSVPECILTSSTPADPCAVDASELSTNGPLFDAAAKIQDPNFYFVDNRDVFCDDAVCSTVIGGIPAYIDSNHLTAIFARSFGERMFPPEVFTSR